jgi:hypothetical protein
MSLAARLIASSSSALVPYSLDSGVQANATDEVEVVYENVIQVDDASWIRLHFDEAHLEEGSLIRISSLFDGATQHLDQTNLRNWNMKSAFFNGNAVSVELVAAPMTSSNFFSIDETAIGGLGGPIPLTICDTDDRVSDFSSGIARMVSSELTGPCTATIVTAAGCFYSAGHCLSELEVAQFHIPNSLPGGIMQHPHPSNQYPVDLLSRRSSNSSEGDDWAHFKCLPNSETGFLVHELEGYHPLSPLVPSDGDLLRITGFGEDDSVTAFTQQMAFGPLLTSTSEIIEYIVDTAPGNSGSAVINANTNRVVGIHTNGGCFVGGGSNSGTSIQHPSIFPGSLCCSPMYGDDDNDGDVDLLDFGQFALCFTGSDGATTPECVGFDHEQDGDIDLLDFGEFQLAFTGAEKGSEESLSIWEFDWSAVCLGGMNNWINDLTVIGVGSSAMLYAGGRFTTACGVPASYIARWDGESWNSVGNQIDDDVNAIAEFDDGSGSALYAAGCFSFFSSGSPVRRIGRWNGTNWTPLGAGVDCDTPLAHCGVCKITDLVVWDNGIHVSLCAGGEFHSAGSINASNIACWDGSSWSELAGGLTGGPFPMVSSLAVFDDGSGSALYAGGRFTLAGDTPVSNIAKWDGQQWSSLGSGLNGGVISLIVFNDGTGSALYAGGGFVRAGGKEVNHIARWNGLEWSALGTGVNGNVSAIEAGDDSLFVGGFFSVAGGVQAHNVAQWDGSTWMPLGLGIGIGLSGVVALEYLPNGSDSVLYTGGNFTTAGAVAARRLAQWHRTAPAPNCP